MGIDWRSGKDVGVFGHNDTTVVHQSELAVRQRGKMVVVKYSIDNYEWECDTVFVDSERKYGLLGQRGFFDYFDVHFRLSSKLFEIRPTIARLRDTLRPG